MCRVTNFFLIVLITGILFETSCQEVETVSGQEHTPGECADHIDNDDNGAVDCEQKSCQNYRFCELFLGTADGDADSDSDSDIEIDTETSAAPDTDADGDSDTIPDEEPDTSPEGSCSDKADCQGQDPKLDCCNNTCVNLKRDKHNCGACNQDCKKSRKGTMCLAGRCRCGGAQGETCQGTMFDSCCEIQGMVSIYSCTPDFYCR